MLVNDCSWWWSKISYQQQREKLFLHHFSYCRLCCQNVPPSREFHSLPASVCLVHSLLLLFSSYSLSPAVVSEQCGTVGYLAPPHPPATIYSSFFLSPLTLHLMNLEPLPLSCCRNNEVLNFEGWRPTEEWSTQRMRPKRLLLQVLCLSSRKAYWHTFPHFFSLFLRLRVPPTSGIHIMWFLCTNWGNCKKGVSCMCVCACVCVCHSFGSYICTQRHAEQKSRLLFSFFHFIPPASHSISPLLPHCNGIKHIK